MLCISALLLIAFGGFHSKNTTGCTLVNICVLLPFVEYTL